MTDDNDRPFKKVRTDDQSDGDHENSIEQIEPIVAPAVETAEFQQDHHNEAPEDYQNVTTVTVPDTATIPSDQENNLHVAQTSDSSDSDSGSDSDSDSPGVELDEAQQEIIKAMEDSLEDDDDAAVERVRPSNEIVNELRAYLYQNSPMDFMEKYCLDEPSPYKPSVVLSALGFPLPIDFVNQRNEDDFRMFLPLAIQHFGKARRRLPYPRTIDDLKPILDKSQNILVLTGAGVSTSLGIPDFRSKHGLYNKLEHLGLTDPQEVFDIRLFREDPSIFYSIAKEILPEHDKFTPTHAFIKLLHDKGKLLRNYTQNIDNVEANAGIPAEKLVQCHGSFASVTCQTCRFKADGELIYNDIRNGVVAKCPLCAKLKPVPTRKRGDDDEDDDDEDAFFGILKPDITFFGEGLPDRFDDLLFGPEGDARKCDLVICIGTSLKVAPVSEIIRIVPNTVPQIYINKQGVTHNEFDITFAGGCDDVVEWLAEQMHWELDHDMNKRLKDSYDIDTFPGGVIEFKPEQAMYRFVDNSDDAVENSKSPVEKSDDAKTDSRHFEEPGTFEKLETTDHDILES